MMPEASALQWVLQGGSSGALLLFIIGFARGWWRTKWEVDAWEARALRAEKLVDTILPGLERLADAVERSIQS